MATDWSPLFGVDQATLSTLLQTVLLEADGSDADESGRVLGAEVVKGVHGRLLGIVQLLGLGATAEDVGVALVASEADETVDTALGSDQAGVEPLTLGREVHAVVQKLAPLLGDEGVAQRAHLAVHDETLKVEMCQAKDGDGRGVITATRLQADEAVLDNVDTADTVGLADGVELGEKLDALGVGLSIDQGLQLDGDTLLEYDVDVLGLVGGSLRVVRHGPHVSWGGLVRVLEHAGLVAAVSQVGVHGVWLGLGAGDGNALLSGEVKQVISASETLEEGRVTPWSNHL